MTGVWKGQSGLFIDKNDGKGPACSHWGERKDKHLVIGINSQKTEMGFTGMSNNWVAMLGNWKVIYLGWLNP